MKTRRTIVTPGYLFSKESTLNTTLKVKKLSPSLLCSSELVIGEGFCTCTKWTLLGTPVCVKQSKGVATEQSALIHEARILALLSHPSVCWLIGIQAEAVPNQIVMPFYSVDGGVKVELYDVLFNKHMEVVLKHFAKRSIAFWRCTLCDIAKGLLYIHNLGLVYRDLKADNIVFQQTIDELKPVIIDFGKCQKVEHTRIYHLTKEEQDKYREHHKHNISRIN